MCGAQAPCGRRRCADVCLLRHLLLLSLRHPHACLCQKWCMLSRRRTDARTHGRVCPVSRAHVQHMAAHLLRSAAAPKDTSCQLISWLGVQVYSRASVLGFSKEELDDILQAIQPEDLQVSLPRPPLCLVLCGPCLLPPLRHCKVALGAALVSMPPAPACHEGVPTSASCQRLTKGTGPRVTPLPGGTGRGREWHCLIGKTAE